MDKNKDGENVLETFGTIREERRKCLCQDTSIKLERNYDFLEYLRPQ